MSMTFRTFSALLNYFVITRGDALRSAQRLPLAILFRAFGAGRAVLRFPAFGAGQQAVVRTFEVGQDR